jgi:hypothetical protein
VFRASLRLGANAEPHSSAPASAPVGLGQRLTRSIASSFDFTCHSQKPAISSYSAKGPSITVQFAGENLTGCAPQIFDLTRKLSF